MRPLDDRMKPVTTHQFSIALCKTFALDPSKIEETVISSEDNSTAVAFSLYAGTSPRINDETNMPYKDNLSVSIFLNFNKSFEININDKTWEVIRVTERQLACVETMEFSPGEFKILRNGGAFLNKTVPEPVCIPLFCRLPRKQIQYSFGVQIKFYRSMSICTIANKPSRVHHFGQQNLTTQHHWKSLPAWKIRFERRKSRDLP